MARLLARMARMARLLARMARWLADLQHSASPQVLIYWLSKQCVLFCSVVGKI